MGTTKIVKCTCINDFQDKKYGRKLRIANYCVSSKHQTVPWRCTVCGKQHS